MIQSLDFNFENFTVAVIKTIDELRSYGKDKAENSIESRINAFYRAIGLPAVLDVETASQLKIDDFNNGNVFADVYKQYESNMLFIKRKNGFKTQVRSDEYKNMLNLKSFKPSFALEKRDRGTILPMVVDGHIPIYPLAKRVANAFTDEDDLDTGSGKEKYKRPLIEAIIHIRLKSIGVKNDQTQKRIENEFNKYFSSILNITPGSKEEKSLISVDNMFGVNAMIAKMIMRAIVTGVDGIDKLILSSTRTVKNCGQSFKLLTDNVAEQSPIKSEEPIENPGENDLAKMALNEQDKDKKALLTLIQFESTSGEKKNAVDNLLLSNLLSIISAEDSKTQKNKEEVTEKEKKALFEIKRSVRTVDLFCGQFGGISGIDILVILAALFEIDLRHLIGLLNEQSKLNLSLLGGGTYKNVVDNSSEMKESLAILEAKVKEIYSQVDILVEQEQSQTPQASKNNQRV